MISRPRSALVLAVLASACSGLQLGSRDRWEQGVPASAVHANVARPQWRQHLAVLTDLDARSRDRSVPAVDPVRGTLIVGGLDAAVHALRLDDGGEVWRFQALGAVEGAAVLEGRTVYVGSNDGGLYALDADTGRMRWRFGSNAEIVHAPVVTAETVYVVNADDTVFALDRATGTARWRYHREPPGGITASGHAGVLVARGCVYSAFADGRVVCIDPAEGTARWERDTSVDDEQVEGANESHRTIDVDTTPLLLDDTLYVASHTAGLYALDPEGGGVRWRVESLRAIHGLSTDGRDLFAVSATRGLMRVDPADGTVMWSRALGSSALGRPTAVRGMLLVPSADHSLWVLRATDGEVLQGLGPDGVNAEPVVWGRWLFFKTTRGTANAWRFVEAEPQAS